MQVKIYLNPLNAELNPICHLLALLGAHHVFHISWLRVNTGLQSALGSHKRFSTSFFEPRKTANVQHKQVLFRSMGMPFGIWQHREWEFPDIVSNTAVAVLKVNQISSPRSCLVFLVVGESRNGEGKKVMITNKQLSLWSLRDVM